MAKAQASGEEPVSEGSAERSHVVCPVAWCPVCLAVTAAQPLQPEAVEHLLKAGTELLLAIRAVIDARAGEVSGQDAAPGPTHLEKIDLG